MTYKIAYDGGHGINTPGKRTPDGEREWSFNDKVVRAFEAELKNYEGVSLKRLDDTSGKTDVSLTKRTNDANAWGANIFVSFHHNAITGVWGTHTGTETFYHRGSSQGGRLAGLVQAANVKAYGIRDRGLKTSNLHITRETNMPAVLIEGGFMDSTVDIVKMRDDSVLANAGKETAKAVAEFAGLKRKGATKTSPAPKVKTKSNVTSSDNLYRVRKSWADAKSQKGAFKSIANAQTEAGKHAGYSVFDSKGNKVASGKAKAPTKASPKKSTSLPNANYHVKNPPFSGSGVRAVQEALASVYFYPDKGAKNNGIDGYYGAKTADAVKRFQSVHGLVADGIYGPKTKAALEKATK